MANGLESDARETGDKVVSGSSNSTDADSLCQGSGCRAGQEEVERRRKALTGCLNSTNDPFRAFQGVFTHCNYILLHISSFEIFIYMFSFSLFYLLLGLCIIIVYLPK